MTCFIPVRWWRFIFPIFLLAGCAEEKNGAAVIDADVTGKVVKIADGDTFTLLTDDNQQVKVRLYGIDCPERSQDFGQVARQKLSDLIFGGKVYVIEKDIDRYKRTIGIVYNQDQINANEAMLQAGLAWHYKTYDKNPEWAQMEENARAQKIGLWSQPNPTPPWDWRKKKREKAAAE